MKTSGVRHMVIRFELNEFYSKNQIFENIEKFDFLYILNIFGNFERLFNEIVRM